MMVVAILATVAALIWSGFTIIGNMVRTISDNRYSGDAALAIIWAVAAVLWFGWWMG